MKWFVNALLLFQGVEPERCPSFIEAMKAGTPVKAYTQPSLADGLTVPTVGCNALATAGRNLNDFMELMQSCRNLLFV